MKPKSGRLMWFRLIQSWAHFVLLCTSVSSWSTTHCNASFFQLHTGESSSIIGTLRWPKGCRSCSVGYRPPGGSSTEFSAASFVHWSSASPVNSVGILWSLPSRARNQHSQTGKHWKNMEKCGKMWNNILQKKEKETSKTQRFHRNHLRPWQQWFRTIPADSGTVACRHKHTRQAR